MFQSRCSESLCPPYGKQVQLTQRGRLWETHRRKGSPKSGGAPAMLMAPFNTHYIQLSGKGEVAAGNLKETAAAFIRAEGGGAAFRCSAPRWREWLAFLFPASNSFMDPGKQRLQQPGCPNCPSAPNTLPLPGLSHAKFCPSDWERGIFSLLSPPSSLSLSSLL